MGKKSKRKTKPSSGLSRREAIVARHDLVRSVGSDPRADADRLRGAFLRLSEDSSAKWDPRRLWLIEDYQEVMTNAVVADDYNRVNFATKEDMEFVKSVSRDRTEVAYIRAILTRVWSTIARFNLEFEYSFQCLHRCLKICNGASEIERQLSYGTLCLGDALKVLAESCQSWFSKLRNIAIYDSPVFWDEKGPEGRNVQIMGCDICLVCRKTYEDLGVASLDCCQKCQLTYYCSRKCQLWDWKEHKKVCRRPGEFKIGDMAHAADPSCARLKLGSWVRILSPASDGPDRLNPRSWLVKERDTGERCVLHSKHLRRCRPALWNMMGAQDIEHISDMLFASREADAAEAAGALSTEEAEGVRKSAEQKWHESIFEGRVDDDFEQMLTKSVRRVVRAEEKAKGLDDIEAERVLNSKKVRSAQDFLDWVAEDYSEDPKADADSDKSVSSVGPSKREGDGDALLSLDKPDEISFPGQEDGTMEDEVEDLEREDEMELVD